MISASAIAAFRAHAAAVYPAEACGLVTEAGYIPCANGAIEPMIDFRIDPAAYAAAGDVRAVLHSHTHTRAADGALVAKPNDFPSVADQVAQPPSGVAWGISVVTVDGAGVPHVAEPFVFGDQAPIPPLVGRPFRHAVTDCYSLIRDWYRAKGVLLPNFVRDDSWWSKGGDLYRQHFAEAGFRAIDAADARAGDVFLARLGTTVPSHGGVYLGDGTVLHHPINQISGRRPVSVFGRFGHQITHWLRHESR